MITKEFVSSRGDIHYHSLNYTDQSTLKEIDADECLVHLSIVLYTLFMDLDKFINIHWTESNVFQQNNSTLMHAKDNAYESRGKYLLSFDAGKTY